MSQVDKNKNFLKLLCNSNKKLRKSLIQNGSKDQINSLCEIVLNLLNGNIKISDEKLNKLSKKRNSLKQFIQKNVAIKKKKYLIQRGGFLEILIPAIISGLASVVTTLIDKI